MWLNFQAVGLVINLDKATWHLTLICMHDAYMLIFDASIAMTNRFHYLLKEGDQLTFMVFGNPGKELYSRNLKLLVPFFDNPSIGLQKIEKVVILYDSN